MQDAVIAVGRAVINPQPILSPARGEGLPGRPYQPRTAAVVLDTAGRALGAGRSAEPSAALRNVCDLPQALAPVQPVAGGRGENCTETLSGFAAVRDPGQLGGWPPRGQPPRATAASVLSAQEGVGLRVRPACPADDFHRAELRPAEAGLPDAGV